jgi:hypothetical protein
MLRFRCTIVSAASYPQSYIIGPESDLVSNYPLTNFYTETLKPFHIQNNSIKMCIGSIVTINCETCGSSTDKPAYLGCATGEHNREGWETRTDSIISRSTYSITSCSSCPDSSSSDSDNLSQKSASSSSLNPTDDYDDEVKDTSTPYYSLGKATILTQLWTNHANTSLEIFSNKMGTLIDRLITLPSTPATSNLKLNIFLICSECDAYLEWTETEHARAVATEATLARVLNNTGVDAEVNAVNVEDMTTEMMELFEDLTGFDAYYDVKYNAGRFEGYLDVLEEMLQKLESQK